MFMSWRLGTPSVVVHLLVAALLCCSTSPLINAQATYNGKVFNFGSVAWWSSQSLATSKTTCAATVQDYIPGRLATIADANENSLVAGLVNNFNGPAWIGGVIIDTTAQSWITGAPYRVGSACVTYCPWGGGQPGGATSTSGVTIATNGNWGTATASNGASSWICEFAAYATWYQKYIGKKKYMLHTARSTWSAAATFCATLTWTPPGIIANSGAGRLAAPRGASENAVAAGLAHLLSTDAGMTALSPAGVILGGSDTATAGTWKWQSPGTMYIQASSLCQVPYCNWAAGEPTGSGSNQIMVMLISSGQWSDAPTNGYYPFMCEFTPRGWTQTYSYSLSLSVTLSLSESVSVIPTHTPSKDLTASKTISESRNTPSLSHELSESKSFSLSASESFTHDSMTMSGSMSLTLSVSLSLSASVSGTGPSLSMTATLSPSHSFSKELSASKSSTPTTTLTYGTLSLSRGSSTPTRSRPSMSLTGSASITQGTPSITETIGSPTMSSSMSLSATISQSMSGTPTWTLSQSLSRGTVTPTLSYEPSLTQSLSPTRGTVTLTRTRPSMSTTDTMTLSFGTPTLSPSGPSMSLTPSVTQTYGTLSPSPSGPTPSMTFTQSPTGPTPSVTTTQSGSPTTVITPTRGTLSLSASGPSLSSTLSETESRTLSPVPTKTPTTSLSSTESRTLTPVPTKSPSVTPRTLR